VDPHSASHGRSDPASAQRSTNTLHCRARTFSFYTTASILLLAASLITSESPTAEQRSGARIKAVDKRKGALIVRRAPPFTKLAVMAILMYLGVRTPRAHTRAGPSRVCGASAWSPTRARIRPCMVTAHTSTESFEGQKEREGERERIALTFRKPATVTRDKTKGP